MKVTAAAQKRAVGLWQTALERQGRSAARAFTRFLEEVKQNPGWTQPAIRDGLKSIFLAYSGDLGSAMNKTLVATMASVLPAHTTSVDFVSESGWEDRLNEAAARCLQQRTVSGAAEVMRVALIDHVTASLEVTQQHLLSVGPKTVRINGEERVFVQEAQSRAGSKLMWERVHEPGACRWCTSEVWQLQEKDWAFSRHHGDRCTRRLVSRPAGTQPR